MDISDGLSIDLARMCEASGVGAELDAIPVARGATREDALHRGEDYELLFSSPAKLPYFRIGRVIAGTGITLDGDPLAPLGYDHFARRGGRSR
jgi:thiamine-monophosphate kinase